MFSLITEFGPCGFGRDGGLVPQIRLGLVRVAWCRGSIIARMEQKLLARAEVWRDALSAKLRSQGDPLGARKAPGKHPANPL